MSSLDLTEANSSGTPGNKPTDRDDLADKVDEPSNTKLDDYSDPNAFIASILSDSNGRRCDTWQTVEKKSWYFHTYSWSIQKGLNTSSRHHEECRAFTADETHMWHIFQRRRFFYF